ncbi:MAG: AbrB/MazE/SpoVT family DNA-binding domain-containing protein [Holophaga sp.]|nr:AbrB/MazE/SpoVT family DNA-binding domain-containing protein [Holophaga sp.]
MRKTLSKHGNSYALVLEKSLMELLHITPETPLEISTDGQSLTIVPQLTRRIAPDELAAHAALAESRYAKTFKVLAE